jgi:hypothetical protein
MTIDINIDDYVSEEEKKDLCLEYIRETLRGDKNHEERVLSNMAYNSAYKLLDEALTEEQKNKIKQKVAKIIADETNFGLFRKKNAWGQEDSEAYLEVKKAVVEHKHLINGLVKKAILEKDYEKEIPKTYDIIGEIIGDAILKGLSK